MKWKTVKAEEPICGRINLTMTYASCTAIYRGLLCMADTVLNYDTGLWDAYLEIAHPIMEHGPNDEEIQTTLFWRNFSDPLEIKEDAIKVSFALAKEIVDGDLPGLNDFLIGHRKGDATNIWPPERSIVLQGPNKLLVIEDASTFASKVSSSH